jgi:hypothetical protein
MIPVCRWDVCVSLKEVLNFLKCCFLFWFFKITQSAVLHLGITSQMTSVTSADFFFSVFKMCVIYCKSRSKSCGKWYLQWLITLPLKNNHFTRVNHTDQSHAASASSMTVTQYCWRKGCRHNMCDIPEEGFQTGGETVIFYTTYRRIRSKRMWYSADCLHFESGRPQDWQSPDLTLVIWLVIP